MYDSDFLASHAASFPEGIISCPYELMDVFVSFAIAVYHSGAKEWVLFLYSGGDPVFGCDSVFHVLIRVLGIYKDVRYFRAAA